MNNKLRCFHPPPPEYKYWKVRVTILFILSGVLLNWQFLGVTFLPEEEYWCSPKELDLPLGLEPPVSLSPLKEGSNETDHCKVYSTSNNSIVSCDRWDFSGLNTVESEFNLVCGRHIYGSTAKSVFMAGVMIGVLASGVISDRYGRRIVIIPASVIMAVFGIGSAFSSSIIDFTILRFFVAASSIAVSTCGYVYIVENTCQKWTGLVGILMNYGWSFGYLILPGIAFALPHWSNLQLAISLPIILWVGAAIIPGVLPESPRWISLTKNKEGEGEEKNKKQPDPQLKQANLFSILKLPHTLSCTLVMFYLWFTNSFVYYGLILNSGSFFPGDVHINNTIAGALEVLSTTILILIFHFNGRRRIVQSVTFLIGGICLLLTLSTEDTTATAVLAQIGKFSISCSFSVVYLYAVELFPTEVRNSGIGASSFCARIGGIIAPYVGNELGEVYKIAPIVIFGLTSLLAGILSLVLPETAREKTTDTVQECEEFLAANPGIFRAYLKKPKDVSRKNVYSNDVSE